MQWPPDKAWTSESPIRGFRHFVAINYGGESTNRWVNLVSVLDGNCYFRIPWAEMKDSSQWHSGWLPLPRDESILTSQIDRNILENRIKDGCLHPSEDSGLLIPSSGDSTRPWDSENDSK